MQFIYQRINRIADELSKYIYTEQRQITGIRYKEGCFKSSGQAEADPGKWENFYTGAKWGGRDRHFRFELRAEIPESFNGKTAALQVKTGREGQWDATNPQFLVYVNGQPVQGMDVNHTGVILCENAAAGESYNIELDAYSGMEKTEAGLDCTVVALDRDVERLYYHIKVPLDVAGLLDEDDKKRLDILSHLNEAVNILDLRKPFSEAFTRSVQQAVQFLEREFYGKYCGSTEAVAHCVGHTHIDVAWMWTVAQTREKAARSFSTVLKLMEEYPEYVFMSSQPQLYQFVKEDHPEIYERIKQRVSEGRWEAEGGMWLEADCNLCSGESLVRQILFGTRFFEKEFGVKNKVLWLPDTFGYSAALPQILKKSGIDYFVTTKINWNEYNKMPYDTFMWAGMDGSAVFTHFITTSEYANPPKSYFTTYNGELKASHVMGAWQRYQHKAINDEVLISYGHGDGGGGTTREMLENAARMSRGIPGCPRVKMGNSLEFLGAIEKKFNGSRLPRWVGELYLEYHRGTYTSMARNKKFNRRSEFLYQDAELLSVISSVAAENGGYPQDSINEGWRGILLNQFHDILPGSSIKQVYEDSRVSYDEILHRGNGLVAGAIKGIASRVELPCTSVIVFNQLGFERSGLAELELPEGWGGIRVSTMDGQAVRCQRAGERKFMFFAEGIPSKGFKAYRIEPKEESGRTEDEGVFKGEELGIPGKVLHSPFFDIAFDEGWNIISLFDKRNDREIIRRGEKANALQAFEDKPHNFDAWDINIYYQEKMWEINEAESAELVENGPLRASVRIRRRFLDSEITQVIRFYSRTPRIDFENHIDWKEKQVLLKAAFPVNIHADKASYEIQYGNVERPTHWNTSWDYARFEVCAHKWADLSQDDYGVSLLNDCKYGHDIKDGVMRLTLLKSAVDPNEDADREAHEFTYSLYPHAGTWRDAKTVQMGYDVNCPVYCAIEEGHKGILPAEFSMAGVDRENVVLEVIKKAEDDEGIIIRAYECYNRTSRVNLKFWGNISRVWECDLMEKNISEIPGRSDGFEFEIMPYEIKTFRLEL